MPDIRLNDVWFWFGSYEITDLERNEAMLNVKLSGGFFTRLTTNIYAPDGTHVATIRNPTLGPVYRQRLTDASGNTLGEIEPRITTTKLLTNARETLAPYRSNGKNKWLKGIHMADVTFRGERFLAESPWPGYRVIEVRKDGDLVLSFKKTFVLSEWLDYIVLRHFLVERSPYDVTIHQDIFGREELVLMAIMVRQFFRHEYGRLT